MKNSRIQVILHRRDGWGEDKKLALTPDQVRLIKWMYDQELVDVDTYDLQILEEAEQWVEI